MIESERAPLRARLWLAGLIALAFVGVVLVTLIPILTSDRGSGRALCAGRLRAIGGALQQYATDNDGTLPLGDAWMDSLLGVLKSEVSLHCPNVGRARGDGHGYAMERRVAGATLATISVPAETWLAFDSADTVRNAVADSSDVPRPGRHAGGNNALAADLRLVFTRP